jgi:MFS family permease
LPNQRITVKSHPPGKAGYFVLEGTNAFAASYYFNYLMFLLQQEHGFSNLNNLTLGAVHGFLYVGASWFAGRFGQRHGYFTSLRIGFGGMGAGVALGWLFPGTVGQVVALLVWTLAMCFTWPMLEALASEREPADRLPHRIGLYNVIWAATAGLAFFLGGTLFQHLGKNSLYWLPLLIHTLQWISLGRLERHHARSTSLGTASSSPAHAADTGPKREARVTQVFQKLAWMGNPFAYMAMNTVIAVVPSIAEHAGLGIEEAGRLMSAWFIVRTLTFAVLWAWHGWHYRVGWFLGSFLLLILGFIAVMTAHQIWILILAQIAFGWGTGLIYYSSLFYAMNGSDTHGQHGGIHEAFIGMGIGSGPAISALTLWLSGAAMAPAIAVGVTLVGGWTWCWRVSRGTQPSPADR